MNKKKSTTENLYNKTLGFKVPAETHLLLNKMSKENNMSVSDVLRIIIPIGLAYSDLIIDKVVLAKLRNDIGFVSPKYSSQQEIKKEDLSEYSLCLKKKMEENKKDAACAAGVLATSILMASIFLKK